MLKKKWLLLLSSFLLALTCFIFIDRFLSYSAQTPVTITLYPVTDTSVRGEYPADSFSADTSLTVYADSTVTVPGDSRALLRFGPETSIPTWCTVTSATLSLYTFNSDSNTVYARRITESWNGSADWNDQPLFEEVIDSASVPETLSGVNTVNFNFTDTVDDWVKRRIIDLGAVILANETGTTTKSNLFYSSEYSNVNYRPRLSVTYIAEDDPPAVSFTSPADGSAVRGTTCTIRGEANDTPGGSGLAKVEVSTNGGSIWDTADGTSEWSYDWTLPADGNYQVLARSVDGAGNESAEETLELTVDKTPPVALIMNPLLPGGILQGKVFIEGTVTAGYSKYYLEYGTGTVPSKWYRVGARHTTPSIISGGVLEDINATYKPDGFYTLRLTAVDAAGNVATDSVTSEIVSTTIPEEPHGEYTPPEKDACASCHRSHSAKGSGLTPDLMRGLYIVPQRVVPSMTLVNVQYESELCYFCHDGLSAANVRGEFDGTESNHPILDYENRSSGRQFLSCVDCHNSHANTHLDATYTFIETKYPRLIRVRKHDQVTYKVLTTTYSGNPVCYMCHGSYTDMPGYGLGGDRRQRFNTSVHNHSLPTPSSGTGIKCSNCHNPHGSDNYRMTSLPEEELCLDCHFSPTSSFSLRSHHDITSAIPGVKVECSSCHGPHTVTTSAVMTEPRNTIKPTSSVTGFCLSCHVPDPPVRITVTNTVVPYTIGYPGIPATGSPFFPGWEKSGFTASGHGSAYDCEKCHHPHGSNNDRLIAYDLDTATSTAEEKLCFNCHSSGGPAGAANVQSDFEKASAHPVTATYDQHRDTENGYDLDYGSGRHAECSDCHNAHLANDIYPAANLVKGPNRGASGGKVKSKTFIPTVSVTYEYEICYKCHSVYTLRPSGQQAADWEFATSNLSFHPVEGTGANSGINSGAFAGSWSDSSLVYCSSCHRGTTAGPHGSDYPPLLERNYATGGTPSQNNAMCFKCHDETCYTSTGADSRWTEHSTSGHDEYCGDCHSSHGNEQRHLINRGYIHQSNGGYLVTDESCTGGGCHQAGVWIGYTTAY